MFFDRRPILSPRRRNRRTRMLQGVFLAVFAPFGWLAIKKAEGLPPIDHFMNHPGLYAYMLLGTMTAFGFFGWLLGREEERLSKLAMLDELTGLANNRLFGQRLDECIIYGRRNGRPVSLLLVDMDYFKSINDTHGHQVGDMALRTVASVIKASIRGSDVAARVGGEEFAVLLPDTSSAEASAVAGRVLNGLRGANVLLENGSRVSLSASIGLAGGIPDKDESSFALFAQADKALYQAKAAGRDRLVSA